MNSFGKMILSALSMLLVALVTVSCGGGGGGTLAGGGIGGTGITASGAITGFGSIHVNGFEFDTAGATREVDGSFDISNGMDDSNILGIGMVVTVVGTLNADGITGTAESITYDDDVQGLVQGPIVNLDQNTKSFSVMGVDVIVYKLKTVFENVTFDTLNGNDLVEISGFFDQDGALQATRLELNPVGEVEVKGTVSNILANKFDLNVINGAIYTVDISSGVQLPDGFDLNLLVEVKGALVGTKITATEVELENDAIGDVEKASIEGIVTEFNSLADFKVDGQQVDASGAGVAFEPSSLQASIANGIDVEVEGPIMGGVLLASEIEARSGDIEIEAVVSNFISNAAGTNGTITLQFSSGSLTVSVDNQTTMRDDTGKADPLTLNDLVRSTDFLEIEAYQDNTNGEIVATDIRRDYIDDDSLRADVDSCSGGQITILGVNFQLSDGITTYIDENDDSSQIATADEFCQAQSSGGFFVKIVDKLPGSGAGTDGIADEAELEG